MGISGTDMMMKAIIQKLMDNPETGVKITEFMRIFQDIQNRVIRMEERQERIENNTVFIMQWLSEDKDPEKTNDVLDSLRLEAGPLEGDYMPTEDSERQANMMDELPEQIHH